MKLLRPPLPLGEGKGEGIRILAILVATGATGCARNVAVLTPAGPQAERIESLWWLFYPILLTIYGAVLAVLVLAIIRSVRAHRAREPESPAVERPSNSDEHPSELPTLEPSPQVERRLTITVGAATAVTVVLLFVFLVTSFRTGRALANHGNEGALVVQITGNRWWWRIRYVDPIASNIVETANELHLPVGRPVALELTSSDVIHSFWVPRLHGKRDLIPGTVSSSVIQADVPGEFTGQCAEFCGFQHSHMGLLVIAEPADQFEAWLKAQRRPAPEPVTEQQKRGRDVFLQGPCVMCHSIAGTPAGAVTAPDLTHVASRRTLGAGTLPNTRGHLAGWILDPQQLKPGVSMPPNPMPPDDLHALLAYLETLK